MRPLRLAAGVRAGAAGLILAVGAFAPSARAAAQAGQPPADQRVRRERAELDDVRRERERLEQRMRELQGTAHEITEEVEIYDRRADATARAVEALDRQLDAMHESVDETTAALLTAEDELVAKRAALRRRLQDIYKRGPLRDVEALLAAESFGQLVARYKYLHLVAQRDRALVARVGALRDRIGDQRQRLVVLAGDMERTRRDRAEEEDRLRALQRERASSLADIQRQARQLGIRVERYRRDEARLTAVIDRLEEARTRAALRAPAAAAATASTLRTSDLGRLDWPVEGTLLYQFGKVISPNNTATRWNGLGIAAASGAPVKVVAPGEVMIAEPIGTYGLTVVVQHGGGDYSVYGSLLRATVRKGDRLAKGEVVGTVGAADPDLPPHVHFEIRPRGRATDPLQWLRQRR